MLTLDLLINGLVIGVFYALMAIGLSLIFGILKVVNFAHGEFYMVGAYAYTLLALMAGVSPWLALPFALIAGLLLGLVVERLLMRPLYSGYTSWGVMRDEYAVIVTFALSIFLINVVDKVVGPYAYKGPALIDISRITIGPIAISGHRLIAAIVAIAVIVIVALIIRYSFWGRQIQAVSQNRLGASLAGIDTAKASAIVFSLAGGLAAISGALLANIFNPTPDVGVFPAIKSYVIVVLGGMGSVPGSIIASIILGVLESFGGVYISYQYRDTFGLFLLILFLLFRPQGLFGEKAREV
ncbi:MAG TPA: branched-chain amino acid ABC transporter permease [Xanthobacteraceae bacterium]|jgi:branched-chain amino acid transport system permease protein|nr:branched-chain amino acid ABC transporter permease [Xanthobacteraceae bacterium]